MLDLVTTNLLASYGTLFLDLASLGILVALIAPGIVPAWKVRFHVQYGLWVACGLAFIGSVMTLYYSEVLNVLPCSLCWLQRAFLYPQVILILIAALLHDRRIALYSIALSMIGALIALYHHWLQMGGAHLFPCPANGSAIDCATPTFVTWGFVTFPFMSFSLFLFLTLFMVWLRQIWRKYPQA